MSLMRNKLDFIDQIKKLCSLSVDFLSHLSLTWRLTIFESLLKLARSVKANFIMSKMTFIFFFKNEKLTLIFPRELLYKKRL